MSALNTRPKGHEGLLDLPTVEAYLGSRDLFPGGDVFSKGIHVALALICEGGISDSYIQVGTSAYGEVHIVGPIVVSSQRLADKQGPSSGYAPEGRQVTTHKLGYLSLF